MIPTSPRTCEHLFKWCAMYQDGGTVLQPRHIRFSIGLYQIGQGMAWKKLASPVRWQSFCSAAMHFMMCAHAYDIDVTADMPVTLEEVTDDFKGWDAMVGALSGAQQQICYSLQSSAASTRASRFKAETLRSRLSELIALCFSLCPSDHRVQCCHDEQVILCRDLPA